MVEYILMVALIAIALIATIIVFQGALSDNVDESLDCLQSISGKTVEGCPGVAQ